MFKRTTWIPLPFLENLSIPGKVIPRNSVSVGLTGRSFHLLSISTPKLPPLEPQALNILQLIQVQQGIKLVSGLKFEKNIKSSGLIY